MNRYEKLGKLISWLTLKSIKLMCLCLVVGIISGFIFEAYTEDIAADIWSAFEIQYEEDKQNLQDQYGIIDDELIQFEEEKSQPVNI